MSVFLSGPLFKYPREVVVSETPDSDRHCKGCDGYECGGFEFSEPETIHRLELENDSLRQRLEEAEHALRTLSTEMAVLEARSEKWEKWEKLDRANQMHAFRAGVGAEPLTKDEERELAVRRIERKP